MSYKFSFETAASIFNISLMKKGSAGFIEYMAPSFRQININIYISVGKNEMGGACGAYGGGETCAQGSGEETWGKETTGETQT